MKALVVAGGLAQIELINQLKERGITTVLIDGNANALARPYAVKFHQMAIFDIEAVKSIFEAVHSESVRQQLRVVNGDNE